MMSRAREAVNSMTGQNNEPTSAGGQGRTGQGQQQQQYQQQQQQQSYNQGPAQAPRYEQKSENRSSRPGSGGQGYEASRPGSGSTQSGSGMNSDMRASQSGEYSFQIGNQEDLDKRRTEMHQVLHSTEGMPHLTESSSFRETISAAGDKKPWEIALEKTEAAAREVTTANFAADEARRALEQAERAENAVRETSSSHDKLLDEAMQLREKLVDPTGLRDDLQRATENLDARQEDAARHNRALREADNAAAAKRSEFEKLRIRLDQFDSIMRRLQQEYDSAMQKSDAVHRDADRRHGQIKDKEQAKDQLGSQLRDLSGQLGDAEADLKAAEEALARAREHHRGLYTETSDVRTKLEGITATYDKEARQAQLALESARGWDEKTGQLRTKMRDEETEHSRLRQLLDRLRQELESAESDLQGLRSRGAPTRQALEEAESLILSRRKALREAVAQVKDSESRYHRLVREADLMQTRASEAVEAAKRHNQVYEQKMKEAQMHQSRHAELWHEAQQAGDRGSETATGAFEKLREKVQTFTNEP